MPTPAFVHVDLDGLWTLPAVYGFDEGNTFTRDPVYETATGRLLDLFARLGIKATFFVIGRDAELEEKAVVIKRIAAAGHELANHSYNHRLDLAELPPEAIRADLTRTGDAIQHITSRRPIGFRAPGYGHAPNVLDAAAAAGISYDGSALPTPWGPALRLMACRLRHKVGGDRTCGRAGRYQYRGAPVMEPTIHHAPEERDVLQLPLAVSPTLRLPLQASLSIMLGAQRTADALERLVAPQQPVTWLLHGLDALGREDLIGRLPAPLMRHRGFRIPLAARMAFIEGVLRRLRDVATIQRTDQWMAERTGHPELARI